MGLILDSSVVIAAERRGDTVELQDIEFRRLGDSHFRRQNQPLNIADRGFCFRDHMDG
ncbi:MAG TPA: hypothetical protein VMU26_26400 [Candidatus Polarisedimenticolia bacterium]|nr:hypothetical protein [Candidatus Polarisedimenticolia bacterium]